MSFKSKKSPVLEELEKIAIQKGLVTVSVLDKIASMPKKQNYVVAENFDENIIKLCSGLREKGFYSQASLLEEDYVICKQAETAYKDSLDYKKLHDAAHAKTTKLKGIDGDSEIEDIFEIKRKIMDVVNKQPKSKYAKLVYQIKKADIYPGQNNIELDVTTITSALGKMLVILKTAKNKERENVVSAANSVGYLLKKFKSFFSYEILNQKELVMQSLNIMNNVKDKIHGWWDDLYDSEEDEFFPLHSEVIQSLKSLSTQLNNIETNKSFSNYNKLKSYKKRLEICNKNVADYVFAVEHENEFETIPKYKEAKNNIFNPTIAKIKDEIIGVEKLLSDEDRVLVETLDKKITNIESMLSSIYKMFIQ